MADFTEIDPQTFAERQTAQPAPDWQLIDVREPAEVELASLPGFRVYSLSRYAEWADRIGQDLDRSKETIVLCHHGMRSAQMCQWLLTQGFEHVVNLRGGIDAYSRLVDARVPLY
ncbi:rhodanese-like domain-containing protein [Synechococcus elongatus IITB4]|uniref:rhodanese-like domain-containing protein n=1 Tax=Synechococcus elongatus TaxID=32046 RepID=UPI0030CCE041